MVRVNAVEFGSISCVVGIARRCFFSASLGDIIKKALGILMPILNSAIIWIRRRHDYVAGDCWDSYEAI
jgi:hypothetical protein